MIYTITLNPSIDYLVRLEHLHTGVVNRMDSDDKFPGGKGINVSRILQRENIPAKALGFLGGFTGDFIEAKLTAEGIATNFTSIAQDTRINVKIKSDNETEINSPGPEVSQDELRTFMDALSDIGTGDIAIFSGSAPASLGNEIYKQLIGRVREQGAEVVCDFEGQTLIAALAFKPLLVKPNAAELGAIYGVTLNSVEEILTYAERLRADGAQHVIVSMAGDGAVMSTPEGNYFAPAIKGTVKNSVGAGDSMVAGFTGAFAQTQDVLAAFKLGVACGTATAFSDDLATHEFISEMLGKVEIGKV